MNYRGEKLNEQVVRLRRQGKTYGEICSLLKAPISKSTLSYWCKDVRLDQKHIDRIRDRMIFHLARQRISALKVNRAKREVYLNQIYLRVAYLSNILKKDDVGKITIAILYWCEGSNTKKGALTFGNSNPDIVNLFLGLLRRVYKIDEKKFRCTVQCRADQSIEKLERYWSRVTRIPRSQFYAARIDPRTVGKVSRKKDYKGVCRIDYFSADVYNELKIMQEVLIK